MTGTWLLFWLAFLLMVTPSEFSDVVGHEPVQVTAGDDVILPCHLKPPFDVSNLVVQWKRNGDTVHLYAKRADSPEDQDEQFRGRTSLFHHEMTKGDISLKLTNVREEDSGLYICYVPKLKSHVKTGNVNLTVNPGKDPGQIGLPGLPGLPLPPEPPALSGVSVVAGHGPVQVALGDDVILPCHLTPQFDVTELTVEWIQDDQYSVHVYRHGIDDDDLQDDYFTKRTSLFRREMAKGNISLKLTNIREKDAGRYICHIPKLDSRVKKGNVLLSVGRKIPPKHPENGGDGNRGVKVGSVLGPVSIIAVPALIIWFI